MASSFVVKWKQLFLFNPCLIASSWIYLESSPTVTNKSIPELKTSLPISWWIFLLKSPNSKISPNTAILRVEKLYKTSNDKATES